MPRASSSPNGPITDYVPVQRVLRKAMKAAAAAPSRHHHPVGHGDLEKVGMLKMDFSAAHPDVVDNTFKLIRKTGPATKSTGTPFRRRRHDLRLLQARRRKGVFQLESDGSRAAQAHEARNIRDLIATNALSDRPLGGGWSRPTSTASMAAKKPTIKHALMEEVLTNYG